MAATSSRFCALLFDNCATCESTCSVPGGAEDEGGSSEEDKEEESEDEAEWMRKLIAGKLSKGDKLVAVDHASVQYPPFRCVAYVLVALTSWWVEPERVISGWLGLLGMLRRDALPLCRRCLRPACFSGCLLRIWGAASLRVMAA